MEKYVKQALIDGVGELHLRMMETEDTTGTAPVYSETLYVTPSVDTFKAAVETDKKTIYLSNLMHDDKERVSTVTITLDAGYLPKGFEEEAQGMTNKGDGAWGMSQSPQKKYFSMAIPTTYDNDEEIIFIFPKCTLALRDVDAKTRSESSDEQIPQFEITAHFPNYGGSDIYYKVELVGEDAAKWDRKKLLTQVVYDDATLNACKVTPRL